MMDWIKKTVISQYANSPRIIQLLSDFNANVSPSADLNNFFDYIFNIETAQGFGLDILGEIVGVKRNLTLPEENSFFGFQSVPPPVWWPYVVLALKFDGANNGTTFTDYSPIGNVPASSQYCSTETSNKKFGTAALTSSGGTDAGQSRLNYAASTNFEYRTQGTVAFWIYIPLGATSGNEFFLTRYNAGTGNGYFSIDRYPTSAVLNTTNFLRGAISDSLTVNYNEWIFITIALDGNDYYLSKNGIVYHRELTDGAMPSGAMNLSVVNFVDRDDLEAFTGNIDDLIFVNGYCIPEYKANFTPPTSSIIYPY